MVRPEVGSVRSHSLVLALAIFSASPALNGQALYPAPPGWVNPRDGLRLAERGRRGMVVSSDAAASRLGIEVLQSGGNAVDAAVAVAVALAVVHPDAGNLGGGGMMLVRMADGRAEAIDYREVLAAAAAPEQYAARLDRYFGARSVGVPGTVAAIGGVHARHGRKPWAEVLEPARRMAVEGVRVSRATEETLSAVSVRLREYPEAARIFLRPDGSAPAEGERLVQRDLARSIARLQQGGWREFYTGKLAREIVADLQRQGSLLTVDDWSGYEARVGEPLRGSYRGHPILTMPTGSSGGVALIEMLNLLELRPPLTREAAGSAATVHRLLEVMKLADYDRRRWYGDPKLEPVEPEMLVDKAYARRIAPPNQDREAGPAAAGKPTQTTHFAVVDTEGNLVSNTYTLQGSLGSMVVPKGTGILLSGAAAYFDTGSGNRNDIGPRKRAIFSMSPTVVLRPDGTPMLAAGAAGGVRIPNVLMQVIVNVVDLGLGVRDAVDAPRLHASSTSQDVPAEVGALSPETVERLRALGHRVVLRTTPLGEAHAIFFDQRGWRYGWADGRFGGSAAGY
ncbi:MAG TPA: gamma-glutamyltransferase [Solibacterales bacterium]|nr:gamma-glutamyltransferase [Bryobacterales bacterium]